MPPHVIPTGRKVGPAACIPRLRAVENYEPAVFPAHAVGASVPALTGSSGRAYIRKARIDSPRELERVILTVANGGSVTDPDVVAALVGQRPRDRTSLGRLTPRELHVLALVADRMSNASIASRLFLTKRAVEKHINAIYAKLELPDESVVCRRVRAAQLYMAEHTWGTTAPPLATRV